MDDAPVHQSQAPCGALVTTRIGRELNSVGALEALLQRFDHLTVRAEDNRGAGHGEPADELSSVVGGGGAEFIGNFDSKPGPSGKWLDGLPAPQQRAGDEALWHFLPEERDERDGFAAALLAERALPIVADPGILRPGVGVSEQQDRAHESVEL